MRFVYNITHIKLLKIVLVLLNSINNRALNYQYLSKRQMRPQILFTLLFHRHLPIIHTNSPRQPRFILCPKLPYLEQLRFPSPCIKLLRYQWFIKSLHKRFNVIELIFLNTTLIQAMTRILNSLLFPLLHYHSNNSRTLVLRCY